MSVRLNRLSAWINANPYRIYADYRDTISNEQAEMLINGEFQSFDESMWEWEINASDYVEWDEWESEFATEAGYDEWDSMPEWLQSFAQDNRTIDCSDLIERSISNWSGHIAATLYKRNGEPIEYQGAWGQAWDKVAARYLKRHCGIDPHRSEPTYAGTYMKAIGRLDLLEIYKAQRKPVAVLVSKHQKTIGHERLNGSGTMGDDQYKGPDRWHKAQFRVDDLDRYGIDSVFGLSGHMWADYMTIKLAAE